IITYMRTAKVKLLALLPAFLFFTSAWHNNLSEAEMIAQKEHKYILLNFSGSDWCGPCIRMKKEIFESDVFKKMADTELILVNADFPRNKKNQPTPEQQKINDATADKYNPLGKFPFTLLLNEKGTVLGSWEGLPNESPEVFIEDIHNDIYTSRK
ncbi:MAG TPA: thioredoxin family protein, partial [Puia sp.]|nr:thioredoxin family protein [Puia sp.]